MANYNSDRSFTDYVHNNLAIKEIYKELGWEPKEISNSYTDTRDMEDGIDYEAIDSIGLKVTIQERFRDSYYKKYNDFTLRYTREFSQREDQHRSEFYKIDASYLIYGITDGSKWPDKRHTLTTFIKYCVVDLNFLKNLFRQGTIKIPDGFSHHCTLNEEKTVLYTSKNRNNDKSSEFIGIDPKMLEEVIGSEIKNLVISERGFLNPSNNDRDVEEF